MTPADILAAFRAWKDERSSVSAEFDVECEREFARRYIAARLAAAAPSAAPPLRPDVPEWLRPHVDKLGVLKDCEVAALCGVRSGLVGMWRQRLGIGRWHAAPSGDLRSVPAIPPSWREKIRDRLGAVADADLAREAGVTRESVRQLRAQLKIPMNLDVTTALRSRKNEGRQRPLPDEARAWFGVVADSEIARRLRVSTSMVARWRARYSLPAPPLGGHTASAFDALTEHFGVMPDTKIATMAGLTYGAVVAYRRTHPELPRSPQSRRGDRS